MCYEMIEVVGMVDACGVCFFAIKLGCCPTAWWRTFLRSRPVGSPPKKWDVFEISF